MYPTPTIAKATETQDAIDILDPEMTTIIAQDQGNSITDLLIRLARCNGTEHDIFSELVTPDSLTEALTRRLGKIKKYANALSGARKKENENAKENHAPQNGQKQTS